MLFCGFQCFSLLLDRCGLGSSSGCSFGFTLAATYFARVVWCATVRQHHYRGFGHCWFGSRGLFLDNGYWLGNNRLGSFDFNRWGLNNLWLAWRFNNRLGDDSHFNRCFCHGLRGGFDNRFDARLNHGHWLADRQFNHWGDCHFFCGSFSNNRLRRFSFHWLDCSRYGCFNGFCGGYFNSFRGSDRSGLFNGCGSAFSLSVGLGFGFSADVAGRNGGGNGQAGCQFSSRWLVAFFSAVFGAFNYIAVGITLTLTTVAATTLTAGAATWALALGAFLVVVLQQLFVRQLLFSRFSNLLARD